MRHRRRSFAERVYRLILRCYPGEFRDEYEREMMQAFRDRLDEECGTGVRPVFGLWRQMAVDALLRAPVEHADVLRQDLRHASRTVRRSPLFAFTAIATLAVGVGANTAIFSVVHAVVLQPLHYAESDRLIRVWEDNPGLAIDGFAVSLPNYVSWRERSRTLDVEAWQDNAVTIRGTRDPVRVDALVVTPGFLSMLGVRPHLGRTFTADDARLDAPRVALITEGLWNRQFGGDRSALGRSVTIDDGVATIVGVVPDAAVPANAEFFQPLRITPANADRSDHVAQVMARLKPGVTMEQARSDLQSIARQLETEYPASNKGWTVTTSTLYDWIVPEETRRALYIVLAAVCCVLLIACANVANLMLARTAARGRELAVRMAMGAGRRRLVRQVLTEGLLLTAVGGAIGVVAAYWAMPVLRGWLPANMPRAADTAINEPVLLFSLLVCAATAVVFSAVPAFAVSRGDIIDALKHDARTHTGGTQRTRQVLAAAQIALATILLTGAGLFSQSLLRLQNVRLGFEPASVATATVGLPSDRYSVSGASWAFYQRLIERLEAAPDVESAAVASAAPFDGGNTGQPIEAVGPSRLEGKSLQADWRMVSGSYFKTLRIPLLRGALFSGNARADERSIVLSEGMARRIWGEADPIGREIAVAPIGNFRVVGIVGDVRNLALAREPNPTMYISTARYLWPAMSIVVRGRADAVQLPSLIRSVVRELDPQLAVYGGQTAAELVRRSAAQPRLNASLVGLFAGMACVLAAIGIYGVLAYVVSQRRQEIGIRMALGAAAPSVLRMFLERGLRLAAVGITAGVLGASIAARWVQSVIFGISPHDPWTMGSAVALVLTVALIASYLPARRATQVDPLTALRAE